jgi:exodeoxyribonuclease VII small subunit
MTQETTSFEKAFERLEQILTLMNSGKQSLEDSLKAFEEAEKLIQVCEKRLTSAEQKIEQLIKSRSGDPILTPQGRPQTETFC